MKIHRLREKHSSRNLSHHLLLCYFLSLKSVKKKVICDLNLFIEFPKRFLAQKLITHFEDIKRHQSHPVLDYINESEIGDREEDPPFF